ncbi:hypothetical protein ACFL6U_01005, partial [Planctomycetota bacterium]
SISTPPPGDNAYPFISIDKGDNRSIRDYGDNTRDNTMQDWAYTRDQLKSYGPVPESNIAGLKPPTIRPMDRIGWSSDGTNDEDDWAATAGLGNSRESRVAGSVRPL